MQRFISAMQAICDCLVQYEIGSVNTVAMPDLLVDGIFIQPCLVLVAHDKMVAQAHNEQHWS